VIGGKAKCLAGNDGGESAAIGAKSGEALRQGRLAAHSYKERACNERAAGYREFIVHPQKS
jgi:hypothetical protein